MLVFSYTYYYITFLTHFFFLFCLTYLLSSHVFFLSPSLDITQSGSPSRLFPPLPTTVRAFSREKTSALSSLVVSHRIAIPRRDDVFVAGYPKITLS